MGGIVSAINFQMAMRPRRTLTQKLATNNDVLGLQGIETDSDATIETPEKELVMPMFLIERNFAEQLEVTPQLAEFVTRANDDVGAKWLHSYLTDDKMKTYCLYEAPSVEVVKEAAVCAGIPADVVVGVSEIRP